MIGAATRGYSAFSFGTTLYPIAESGVLALRDGRVLALPFWAGGEVRVVDGRRAISNPGRPRSLDLVSIRIGPGETGLQVTDDGGELA